MMMICEYYNIYKFDMETDVKRYKYLVLVFVETNVLFLRSKRVVLCGIFRFEPIEENE